eukprot:scaffold38786_cov31-Tisochrysis_lutea.AAC.1
MRLGGHETSISSAPSRGVASSSSALPVPRLSVRLDRPSAVARTTAAYRPPPWLTTSTGSVPIAVSQTLEAEKKRGSGSAARLVGSS